MELLKIKLLLREHMNDPIHIVDIQAIQWYQWFFFYIYISYG